MCCGRLWAQLCQRAGLGNEPRKVFQELAEVMLVDVLLPTRSGVTIRKRCVSRPTEHQAILLLSVSVWNCRARWRWPECSKDSGMSLLKIHDLFAQLRKMG
jgi:hypothetical protein